MRSCRMWTLALAAVIAWCASPNAAADEKPKPVPEEGSLQVVLLRHKAVRDDLKLTHREARKIHEFTEEQWKKAERVEELPDAKERDRKYEEMTKENEKFLDEVLTGTQHKRLHQITLQVAGLLWINRPEVAAELKLTDEQKKKAVEYQEEARKEMEELLHSTTRRDRHAELRKLHEASKKRLLELLDRRARDEVPRDDGRIRSTASSASTSPRLSRTSDHSTVASGESRKNAFGIHSSLVLHWKENSCSREAMGGLKGRRSPARGETPGTGIAGPSPVHPEGVPEPVPPAALGRGRMGAAVGSRGFTPGFAPAALQAAKSLVNTRAPSALNRST